MTRFISSAVLVMALALNAGAQARAFTNPVDCANPAALEPSGILGKGPNGEQAAGPDSVALSDADAAKVRASNFKVGLVFQFMNDWSRDQIAGLTDTFKNYGVEIIGTTDAQFKVPKQIADLENMITLKPDGIISIPVDDVAMGPTYAKVSKAGIKLVFMDNAAKGLS